MSARALARFVRRSRAGRTAAVVATAVVPAIAISATPLPPSVGLLLGALAGTAVAALGARDDEPGPDTADSDPDPDASEDGD